VFKHILIPTDFSTPAERALDVGLELARRFDARVSIMHAYQFLVPLPYMAAVALPFEEIAARAEQHMAAEVAKVRARYAKCESVLRPGTPADEIVGAALDAGADLIVLGTHGRRGVSHAILGSTAERVVRTSPIPVLTVGPRGEGAR
jgi:nucleotide-binding universal stress UspA family protein